MSDMLPRLGDVVSPARIAAVADQLGPQPFCFGRPAADRAAWRTLAESGAFAKTIETAAEGTTQTFGLIDDELYLEFSRTGNRTHWQDAHNKRNRYLTPLALAECLEYEGRFLAALERLIDVVCEDRTWVMPAHDARLTNFHRTMIYIDLASSATAWELACIDYLLGDRLSPAIRRKIRENIEWRIFEPMRETVAGRREGNWWMIGTNNWNSVCLAGVTGAALQQIADPAERAWYVAVAEEYSRYFLAGFTPDGYCSEGVGYWCYGFGRYMLLADTILRATNGSLDLMASPAAQAAARYGARIEIRPGVSPAFADCSVTARPSALIMHYVNRRLGLGIERWAQLNPAQPAGAIFETLMFCFDHPASASALPGGPMSELGLRDWFADGQVYIGRPTDGAATKLAVAFKGGHNQEHHNHNDLGSYVAVVGCSMLATDPGGEVYTRRTFSPHRYVSNVLNSFGHSVPRIAGKLQETGREAAARVLATEFSDGADRVVFDLAGGYAVASLQCLERTFVYDRAGRGSLTVTDRVAFSEPTEFETAVVTSAEWREIAPGVLEFREKGDATRVEIAAQGGEIVIEREEIHEDVRTPRLPMRFGIRFTGPVTQASVTVRIVPVD